MRIGQGIFLLMCAINIAYAQPLKVMTYNIRLDLSSDGVNIWPNRKEKVFELIIRNSPDAFAVQEAVPKQMQDLAKALPNYAFVGVGREDGKDKGEYTAIFYKKSRLRVVESSSFWLSETPDVPGSKSWDAAITRMVTWAQFEDKKSKQPFLMITTHFDHVGAVARLQSAMAIKSWIKKKTAEKNLPIILCGDFNFQPEEEPYGELVGQVAPMLIDARPAGEARGTFCGFEKDKMECNIIDYIFLSVEWQKNSFEVLTDNDGTYYPSDHLPVVAIVTLAN